MPSKTLGLATGAQYRAFVTQFKDSLGGQDAVTALGGSGPAYFYFLVEHLVRAGIEMGLKPEDATKMAIKTAAGAGKLLSSSIESPAELRRKVTTPGGTTHAAISHMESQDFGKIVVDAIKAAEARGRELGKQA